MRTRNRQQRQPPRVLGYARVSTQEQGDSRLGLDSQRAALRTAADARGWILTDVVDEVASGKTLDRRPALAGSLAAVRSGAADALAVARVDRLSRNTLDVLNLVEASRREGWHLIFLDCDFDCLTPEGELMLTIWAGLAHQARRRIGENTRLALQAKRVRGERLGRPRLTPAWILERVVRARARGTSWKRIAERLDRDHIPTVRGGSQWRPSSVQRCHAAAMYARTLAGAA